MSDLGEMTNAGLAERLIDECKVREMEGWHSVPDVVAEAARRLSVQGSEGETTGVRRVADRLDRGDKAAMPVGASLIRALDNAVGSLKAEREMAEADLAEARAEIEGLRVEFDRRGTKIIEMTEQIGMWMCRAEKAEAEIERAVAAEREACAEIVAKAVRECGSSETKQCLFGGAKGRAVLHALRARSEPKP